MASLLLCRTGDAAGLAHLIERGERCRIGRSPECELPLLHPQLSREHAAISVSEEGEVSVEDLRSSNGTALNGEALEPGQPVGVKHLDHVSVAALDFVHLDLERIPHSEVVAAHLVDPSGARVPLQLGVAKIGSDEGNDLIVEAPDVAPVHAVLELDASGLRVRSEAGPGKLRVNEESVTATELSDGDLVRLSDTLDFQVELFSGRGPAGDAGSVSDRMPPRTEPAKAQSEVATEEEQEAATPSSLPVGLDVPSEGPAAATSQLTNVEESVRRARERHRRLMAADATRMPEVKSTEGHGSTDSQALEEGRVRRAWAGPEQQRFQAVRREAAVRMRFRLPDSDHDGAVLLREGRHVVGRDAQARAVLADSSVSRQHAEIWVAPGEIRIRDLGSTNGLVHDGRRVEEAKLQPGDRIRFGDVEAWFESI